MITNKTPSRNTPLRAVQAAFGRVAVPKEEDGETILEGGRPFNYCEILAIQHRMCMRQATMGARLIKDHQEYSKKRSSEAIVLKVSVYMARS